MFLRCNLRWALMVIAVAGVSLAPAVPATAEEEQQAESAPAVEEETEEPQKTPERKWRMRLIGAIGGDSGGVLMSHGDPYACSAGTFRANSGN